MKGILKIHAQYIQFFLIILLFLFLSSCNGGTPATPVINTFTASSTSITEGEDVTLSWEVTDATSVIINPGSITGALSGSTSVSPVETTTYILTATNTTVSNTATVTVTVNPTVTEQTLTIQPGSEGKDTYMTTKSPALNSANYEFLMIGISPVSAMGITRADLVFHDTYRALLQFNLNTLPADAVITNASLKLYSDGHSGTEDFMIASCQVTEDWEENVYWTIMPDYSIFPESTITVPISQFGWLSWDITSLVQGWANGSIANYGVMLKETGETVYSSIYCFSSDYSYNITRRPKLEISYYVP
jgi:hypothetical protein